MAVWYRDAGETEELVRSSKTLNNLQTGEGKGPTGLLWGAKALQNPNLQPPPKAKSACGCNYLLFCGVWGLGFRQVRGRSLNARITDTEDAVNAVCPQEFR